MRREPVPAAQAEHIRRGTRAHRPLAAVRVVHGVHFLARAVHEAEIVLGIRQPSRPVADHVGHAGVGGEKVRAVRRDHEVAARRKRDVREREFHPARQPPAVQADGVAAAIEQLDPLAPRVFRLRSGVRRVIQDFVDDHIGGDQGQRRQAREQQCGDRPFVHSFGQHRRTRPTLAEQPINSSRNM